MSKLNINYVALKRILDDSNSVDSRIEGLCAAFIWGETPQGVHYWYLETENLRYNPHELSHEALMYLTVLYDQLLLDHENVITETNSTIDLAT